MGQASKRTMMMSWCPILVVTAGLSCPLPSLAQRTERWFELGGPRKATARIIPNDTVLDVTVEMIAVKSFSDATNKLLSQEKAIRYVQLAIGNYLVKASEKPVRLSLPGLEILSSKIHEDRFRLDVRIPRPSDARLEELRTDTIDKKVKQDAFDAEVNADANSLGPTRYIRIFAASEDYCETSQFLLRALKSEIPACPVDSNDEKRELYFRSISDLEEKAKDEFDLLTREVKQCKILLSVEIDPIVKQIIADRTEFDELLRNLVDSLLTPEGD